MNNSRKPLPDNKPSLLLSNEQNEVIFRLLGPRCQSSATAVVQVVLSDVPAHSRWIKRHCGVACFVRDSQRRSYFIRVFCPERQIALWEQEMYNGFQYKAPKPYFHTFEGDESMAGLNFADEEEAIRFQNAIDSFIRKKLERRENKKRLSGVNNTAPKALATRNENFNNVMNGSAVVVQQQPPRMEMPKPDMHPSFKKGKKEKVKLRKEDIGAPTNFQHVQHVGWDANRGFALENVDEQLKPFFQMAGITEDHLTDQETRNFIYDFISQHGGVEAAMLEMSKPAPPPVPARGPATPQVNRSAPPPPVRQQAPPPPARGVPARPSPKQAHASPVAPAAQLPPIASGPPPPPPPPPPMPAAGLIAPPPPMPPMMGSPAPPAGGRPGGLPPAAQPDTRNALMDAIRGGAALKKVDPSATANRKSSVDSRGDLLDQIRSGIELKKAKAVTQNEPDSKSSGGSDGLAGALAKALADRSRVIQSDSDSGSSGSESGEDEDDWD